MNRQFNKKYKYFNQYLKMVTRNRYIKLVVVFIMLLIVSIISLIEPWVFQMILDEGIVQNKKMVLVQLCLVILVIRGLSAILNTLVNTFFSKLKRKSSNVLRNIILKLLSRKNGKYFSEKKSGELLYVLENDLFNIENLGIDWLFNGILNIITAIVSFIILITINVKLIFIVLTIQIAMIFANVTINTVIAKKTNEVRDIAGGITNILEEYISNTESIVISKGLGFMWKKIFNRERRFLKESITLDLIITVSNQVYIILNVFLIISIYLIGGINVIEGTMTIGEIIAFTQYTNLLLGPCMNLLQNNTRIQQVLVSINRVFNIINDGKNKKNNHNRMERMTDNMGYNIRFENVSFGYRQQELLKDFNIEIPNGKISAIVGRSGSGKTTVAKLIFKLWKVKNGGIFIDDYNINDLNTYELRKHIEYIPQEVFMFNDSFLNNLVLDQKNVDMDTVKEICQKVGIWDLINKQPEGINTIIGERGMKLSGGEKQRLAIARGLIRNSKILILDESTSALDNISQANLLNQIRPMITNKTVIMIAHRLSTITSADEIWVMENGKIMEHGTHEYLMEQRGIYCHLLEQENFNKNQIANI